MTTSDLAAELRQLRSELDALKQAERKKAPTAAAKPSAAQVQDILNGITWNNEDIAQQVKKIAGLVKEEAEGRPLLTLLIVLAFGILLGRLIR